MATIENIVDRYPYPTVTPIISQPGYEIISEMYLQLNANKASIQYHIENGTLSNLLLKATPAVLNTLSATPLVLPPKPGQDPIILTGSTGPQIVDICNAHGRKNKSVQNV